MKIVSAIMDPPQPVSYRIVNTLPGQKWAIHKRYSEFRELYEQVSASHHCHRAQSQTQSTTHD